MTVNPKAWSSRNKAITDVGVYYVSTAVNQAVPFLLLPVFTVYLLPTDFGFINTFSALLVLATSLFSGLSHTINKHFYAQSQDFNRLLIGNLYLILAMGTILTFLLSMALPLFFEIRSIPKPYFLAIPLVMFFNISLVFLKTLLRASKRTMAYAVLTFSEVMVDVSISLILVIGFSWHWQGRVVGIMLSTMIFGTVAMLFLIKKEKIVLSFKTEIFRDILKVGLPLIPLSLSVMIMRRSGVLFIDSSLGKDEAGLYGVALNLATIILFLSVPLINVWTPHIYEKLAHDASRNSLNRLYHRLFLLVAGICFLGLVISLFSNPFLSLMTTKAFAPAGRFIPWQAFGFCMWATMALLTPFLIHFNKQRLIAMNAIGGAVVNLGLNYYLIRRFGSIGAAMSFLISNLLCASIMFAIVRRVGRLPFFPSFRLLLHEAKGVFK